MADLSYDVVVNLTSRGNLTSTLSGLNSRIGSTQSALTGLGNTVGSIGSTIAGAFTGAVESVASLGAHLAVIGAGAAFAGLVASVTGLNSKLEETQISMASIFTANGISDNMTEGLAASSVLMDKMRKDAADLPGEFKDLVNIFQMAAAPGLKAGLTANTLEDMSAKVMAAGVATGVNMPVAAREFAMLLSGHAGAHNLLGMKVFGLSGDDAKAFNKLDNAERLKVLSEGLDKFAPAIEVFRNSWVGLSSSLKDEALRMASLATGGLFTRVKETTRDLLDWFDGNREQIRAWSGFIGQQLIRAFDFGREKILEWGPVVMTFAGNAFEHLKSIWERIEPIVERISLRLKEALTDPGTFDKIDGVLKAYAALKVGGALTPMLPTPSAIGTMGSAIGLGGMELVGASAAVAIPVLLGAAGAIDVLTNSASKSHAAAVVDAKNLGKGLDELRESVWGVNAPIRDLADFIGSVWLTTVTASITTVNLLGDAFKKMTNWLGILHQQVSILTGSQVTTQVMNDYEHFEKSLVGPDKADTLADAILNKKAPTTVTGGGGTHIQKVEIVISSSADPSRIARLTVSELARLSRHPKSSRGATNFSRASNG